MQNNQSQSQCPLSPKAQSQSTTVPQLTNEELYASLMLELRDSLSRAETKYDAFLIKKTVAKLFKANYMKLTDIQLGSFVHQLTAFFKEHQRVPARMSAIRYLHELIIEIQRFRSIIAGVVVEMFVETMEQVKGENMFYYVKELKSMNRIWYGFIDGLTLKKIREYCMISLKIDIMDLDISEKYFEREFKAVKLEKYTAKKIIHANPNRMYPQSQINPSFNNNQANKPKNFTKKPSSNDKDQTLSNQTNAASQTKEKIEEDFSSPTSQQRPKQESKDDKAAKLKEMYALMLSKKKKKGSKFLASSGHWQISQAILQALKSKTYKQEIYNYINRQIEQQQEEWVYPLDKEEQQKKTNPFQFQCKFCRSKLQAKTEGEKQYFNDIICFQVRRGDKKFNLACFHYQTQEEQEQGIFVLHRDCFEVLRKGEIDEKKWDLQ